MYGLNYELIAYAQLFLVFVLSRGLSSSGSSVSDRLGNTALQYPLFTAQHSLSLSMK